MENKIMDEKAKMANLLKIFKELITLHSDKITEKSLNILKRAFVKYERATDKNKNDLEYLKDLVSGLNMTFKSFIDRYDIDYTPKNKQ